MTTRSMDAPFGWFTKMGMGLLSFFAQFGDAGSSSGGDQAQASSGDAAGVSSYQTKDTTTGKRPPFPMPSCCAVYFPNGPFCDYPGSDPSQYTCPQGYYRQWWFCPPTNSFGACAECTTDKDTCWRGDFLCSTWWYI